MARLTDCFMGLIAYTAYFLKTAEARQPSYETVKGEIDRLISESQALCLQGNFPQDEYDLARFAVFAWIDEAILSSGWEGKKPWLSEQLQRIFYQTTDAGELFYERLNRVGLGQRDVREIYYLCLSMGFTGRYCHAGDEFLLDQLKSSNLKLLAGSAAGLPSLDRGGLFPEAYAEAGAEPFQPQTKSRFSMVTLLGLGVPVALFFLLFALYRFVLGNLGDNLFRMGS